MNKDENEINININLNNYDEAIKKLEQIKKLLNEIKNITNEEKDELINLIIQEIRKKEKEVGRLPIQI